MAIQRVINESYYLCQTCQTSCHRWLFPYNVEPFSLNGVILRHSTYNHWEVKFNSSKLWWIYRTKLFDFWQSVSSLMASGWNILIGLIASSDIDYIYRLHGLTGFTQQLQLLEMFVFYSSTNLTSILPNAFQFMRILILLSCSDSRCPMNHL